MKLCKNKNWLHTITDHSLRQCFRCGYRSSSRHWSTLYYYMRHRRTSLSP